MRPHIKFVFQLPVVREIEQSQVRLFLMKINGFDKEILGILRILCQITTLFENFYLRIELVLHKSAFLILFSMIFPVVENFCFF